jgi:hypothetical protein
MEGLENTFDPTVESKLREAGFTVHPSTVDELGLRDALVDRFAVLNVKRMSGDISASEREERICVEFLTGVILQDTHTDHDDRRVVRERLKQDPDLGPIISTNKLSLNFQTPAYLLLSRRGVMNDADVRSVNSHYGSLDIDGRIAYVRELENKVLGELQKINPTLVDGIK